MIGITDAITLARTKLRSKRVMLITTIVISGLLFGVLYAATIIADGVSKTANTYTHAALDGKYLVRSNPAIPDSIYGLEVMNPPKQLIDELKAVEADYITQQKAIAKQFDIPYDEKGLEPILQPSPFADKSLPADEQVMINRKSPVYNLYIQKLQRDYIAHAKNKRSDLQQLAAQYGAVAYHTNELASVGLPTMSYLKDGKEDLTKIGSNARPSSSGFTTYGYTINSVQNSSYRFIDDSLVKRFILPTNDKRRSDTTAIPVIITTAEAIDLFGKQLGIPEKPAKAAEQLTWMKQLQQKINGTTYTACYRNQAETALIAQVIQANAEMERNKNNKAYVKPSLIYNLPTEPCGDITVKEDTRTAQEKEATTKQEEISKQLGTYTARQHQLLTFQVVGVMQVSPEEDAMKSLPVFMTELLGPQYGDVGAIIPKQSYDTLPAEARHENVLRDYQGPGREMQAAGIGETIVEFTSLDNARSFIKQGCPDLYNACNKPFAFEAYGSNYLLMDDLHKTGAKILRTALPIALAVAGIIISATMARVIIDSRRETAVFRAIGAKRSDIVSIYLLYSMNVAIRIIIFALLLGLSIACLVQVFYSNQVAIQAKVAYGIFNQEQAFSFIGFNSPLLLWLAVCIAGISLIAILPPLLRNVRRNPIEDMRSE